MQISFSGAENESLSAASIVVSGEELGRNGIATLNDVISYVYRTEPRAHRSFFKADGTLANGTICLLDDQDADMYEPGEQLVGPDSSVVFISTLHGG